MDARPEGSGRQGPRWGHLQARASVRGRQHRRPRTQRLRWRAGEGPTWTFANQYGEPAGRGEATLATSKAVRDSAAMAAEYGAGPSLIVGDLNVELQDLACLPTLVAGGWNDCAEAPTCAASNTTRETRIDHVLANAPARELGLACEVDWTLGLPTHAAHRITTPAAKAERVPRRVAAPPMP